MRNKNVPNITTPHNNFFLQVFSRKEKAIAFFQKYLPKAILKIADLNQIELVESKHMSDAGFSLYNDILYNLFNLLTFSLNLNLDLSVLNFLNHLMIKVFHFHLYLQNSFHFLKI